VAIPYSDGFIGGTVDAAAETEIGTIPIDFKTSSGIYESHVLQISGYYEGLNYTYDYKLDGLCVLRIPKDEGEFQTWHEDDQGKIEEHINAFKNAANLKMWRDDLSL
jgi:hypothetical protein